MSTEPLHNRDAEACALAGVLRQPESEAFFELIDRLRASDFFRPEHRRVFEAMQRVVERNGVPDLETVGVELIESGTAALASQAVPLFLASLADHAPSAAELPRFSRIVRDHSQRRQAQSRLQEGIVRLRDPEQSPASVLDQIEQGLFEVRHKEQEREARLVSADIEDAIQRMQEPPEPGVRTGLLELDEILGGLRCGELILLGARPSIGKTALALNIARHAARDNRVLFASLEVPRERMLENLLAQDSGVPSNRMRDRRIGEEDLAKLRRAAEDLKQTSLVVFDPSGLSPMALRSQVRRQRSFGDLGLVVVDYVGLMQMPKAENRQVAVSMVSAALKQIARDYGVPVLALTQLNRSSERDERNPRLSDLRDSGALEQDADVVLLLHRENRTASTARLEVAKHRNGPTGKVDLVFTLGCLRFADALGFEPA